MRKKEEEEENGNEVDLYLKAPETTEKIDEIEAGKMLKKRKMFHQRNINNHLYYMANPPTSPISFNPASFAFQKTFKYLFRFSNTVAGIDF